MHHLAILLALASPLALTRLPASGTPLPLVAGAAEPAVPEAWLQRAADVVRRGEYAFSPLGSGVFSAPNRGQELRARVSAWGLELFPRSVSADGEGAPWRLALRTRGFGRADGALELAAAKLGACGERIELEHGSLLEWLENRAEGLEHGWTIALRPDGSAPLCIDLELGGDLTLWIEEGGRSGVLVDATGETRLCYAGLHAFDARGRALDACLVSAADGVRIQVEDAGATYPLTVDPLLTGADWTAEADQGGAFFGSSVSTAGDVNGDGYADVVVSAPWYDGGELDEGRVYVFHGSASGLSTTPDWTAESDQAESRFGISVATAGDVNGDGYADVIIGADTFENGEPYEGRVFVFHGSASGLSATSNWTAESDLVLAGFGQSVATAGDVNGDGFADVIIGAPWSENHEFAASEGRAYVYHGSASGLAASPAWTVEGNQFFGLLGSSVSTAGDVNGDGYDDVIVGIHGYSNDLAGEGGAYVYLGSASGLATTPAWTAEGDQEQAHFGCSVATAGDVNGDGYADVIVGAHLYDTHLRRPTASLGGLGQGSVSSPRSSFTEEGRVFVYLGSPNGLSTTANWTAEGDQRFANLGNAVATAGDLNGDGYADVLVGAPFYHNGEAHEGRVYVYLGSASGLAASPARVGESDQVGALFGWAVSTAGDVNGDGFADFIVGAPSFDGTLPDQGRACVFLGP